MQAMDHGILWIMADTLLQSAEARYLDAITEVCKMPNALERFTDAALERRINTVETWIAAEADPKNLPALNAAFQKLLDEQVRRDLGRKVKRNERVIAG